MIHVIVEGTVDYVFTSDRESCKAITEEGGDASKIKLWAADEFGTHSRNVKDVVE